MRRSVEGICGGTPIVVALSANIDLRVVVGGEAASGVVIHQRSQRRTHLIGIDFSQLAIGNDESGQQIRMNSVKHVVMDRLLMRIVTGCARDADRACFLTCG
jgi:hypothetical protein